MYGIYANIWGILMGYDGIHVTIYGIHGSYGIVTSSSAFSIFSLMKSPLPGILQELPAQDSATLPLLASHLRGRSTAMVGLHLCGNLSVRAVELFEELLGDVWFSGYSRERLSAGFFQ